MRIERVAENKIKVLIDREEAKEWNITVGKISQNTPEAQQMFLHAISLAKESVDFSVDGAKLFIETIPSFEDGIGMFITKVSSDHELETAVNNCGYKGKVRKTELKPKRVKVYKHIYSFDELDDASKAAQMLKGLYLGKSTLYKLGERYYLNLVPEETIHIVEADLVLCEFAHREQKCQYLLGKLNEYGEVMIKDNALEVLDKYFSFV